ncbi:MAG TPA: Flp family type IVb pilin [Candidatus Dormibacteraeota bacterium]|nr:Flp family type IVb pilin [Candidatus Dormibacteraeota bacterium]
MNRTQRRQSGQGMVEYALILVLVAMIVIIALIATGGQIMNLYSDIIAHTRGAGL